MPTLRQRWLVFGHVVDLERMADRWQAFDVGPDGKRTPAGFVVPDFIEPDELGQFLFDLFHEKATGRGDEVRRVD